MGAAITAVVVFVVFWAFVNAPDRPPEQTHAPAQDNYVYTTRVRLDEVCARVPCDTVEEGRLTVDDPTCVDEDGDALRQFDECSVAGEPSTARWIRTQSS